MLPIKLNLKINRISTYHLLGNNKHGLRKTPITLQITMGTTEPHKHDRLPNSHVPTEIKTDKSYTQEVL